MVHYMLDRGTSITDAHTLPSGHLSSIGIHSVMPPLLAAITASCCCSQWLLVVLSKH